MKLLSLLSLFAAFLVSCSPNVRVVDEAGYPLSGARITAAARSISYSPVTTNEKGEASIQQNFPYIEYLHVDKPGYQPARNISFDLPKPIVITLKR